MRDLILPEKYSSKLSLKDTQKAIKLIKDTFQQKLSVSLNLDRITAPLIVTSKSGINDDLNGIERKVEFDTKRIGTQCEVVQSLAKWKRMALYRYGYSAGEGIYTDMSAIRRDDECDNVHSIYVDQWDWERVINRDDRCVEFLEDIVKKIVKAISDAEDVVMNEYRTLSKKVCTDVFFITTQQLEDMYPDKTPKERENLIVREHKTVFIMQIGDLLKSGIKHDGRAPDYDDWTLNGDIFVWDDVLNSALELSSMGIRVDEKSIVSQLEKANASDRLKFEFHKLIAECKLPLTIGGGIGQSRLCMFLLEKAHIGEVQVSVWPDEMRDECKKDNIILL